MLLLNYVFIRFFSKKMFNQDEGKIEFVVGNRAGQESRDCFDFISDVDIRGIYLSLALGTAKQLD